MKSAKRPIWPSWELAWEFLRRNPKYRQWYASLQKTATTLLCSYYGERLTDAQLARLRTGIARAPVLCRATVIPLLKHFGLKAERDCAVFDILDDTAGHAQRAYWLYAPANPDCEYRKWKTDVLDFFVSASEMPPQTVAYHTDPFLEHPHTITVTVNLRAPDDEIWPALKYHLDEQRKTRKIVRPRKRRRLDEHRQLLEIYDAAEYRQEVGKPRFPASANDPQARQKYEKLNAAKKLIEGNYKTLLFGPSVLTDQVKTQ